MENEVVEIVESVVETVTQTADAPMGLMDSLGVAAIGLITVFAGLVILIAFIKILSVFTSRAGKKKTDSTVKPVKEDTRLDTPTVPVTETQGVPAEVIAAITAALTVIMGDDKFTVRHVKRIQNASAWNLAGRKEQMYSRF